MYEKIKIKIRIVIISIFLMIVAGGLYFGYEYYKNLKEQKIENLEPVNISTTKEEKASKEYMIKSLSVPGGVNKSSYTSEDVKNMKNISVPPDIKYQNAPDKETQKFLESIGVPYNK